MEGPGREAWSGFGGCLTSVQRTMFGSSSQVWGEFVYMCTHTRMQLLYSYVHVRTCTHMFVHTVHSWVNSTGGRFGIEALLKWL